MNSKPARLSRRQFARLTVLAGLALAAHSAEAADAPAPLRAAIIGFTGGGDYGHGHDRIFTGLEGGDVVAVADPDKASRTGAMRRTSVTARATPLQGARGVASKRTAGPGGPPQRQAGGPPLRSRTMPPLSGR